MRSVALLLLVLASACATPEPRPSHAIEGFPDVIQGNNYSCGVAAVQGVLQFHGIWGYQDDYAKELGTTKDDGTHPARMVAYLRKRGLEAELREGLSVADLERFVDEGVVVIVDFQAWHENAKGYDYAQEWEDGHYCVLTGYDSERLFFEDPVLLGSVGWVAIPDFEKRWHDYETENGKRREYVRSGIVVRGKREPLPRAVPIE